MKKKILGLGLILMFSILIYAKKPISPQRIKIMDCGRGWYLMQDITGAAKYEFMLEKKILDSKGNVLSAVKVPWKSKSYTPYNYKNWNHCVPNFIRKLIPPKYSVLPGTIDNSYICMLQSDDEGIINEVWITPHFRRVNDKRELTGITISLFE